MDIIYVRFDIEKNVYQKALKRKILVCFYQIVRGIKGMLSNAKKKLKYYKI